MSEFIVNINGQDIVVDSAEVEIIRAQQASIVAEDEATVTVVFAVDLWTRATEDEAEQIEASMNQQPVRLRNIFRTANSFRSDSQLWPLLRGIAAQLFGEERAAVLLAPSDSALA